MASIIEDKGLNYGIRTFLDERDIEGGESIPDSVRKNIRECNEFLVLLSPYSINRPWVLAENRSSMGTWQTRCCHYR
jgi:hypothetical protein